MPLEYEPTEVMDRSSRSNRYYRNAVERHWDPHEVDLETDRQNLIKAAESDQWEDFIDEDEDDLRRGLALFGAGEDAVTEDLAPLAVVMEDIDDQMFLTTQLYEEAKHGDFFDRYWREVIHELEDEMGWSRSSPRDDKWFNDAYEELFDRNRKAQYRLLEEDTVENRTIAICHYHLTIEGILAQTGYYGMQTAFGGQFEEIPNLPGLVEGFSNIRSDEGRHVGFGMHKLKQYIQAGKIDPELVKSTVNELIPFVSGLTAVVQYEDADEYGLSPDDLAKYAYEKHDERMEQLADADAELPDVDELVRLEGAD